MCAPRSGAPRPGTARAVATRSRRPTTQSAVLTFFTFTIARWPGRYRMSSFLATTPSSPSASNVSNHASASSNESVCGVSKTWVEPGPGTPLLSRPESSDASSSRRASSGESISERSPTASRSNATNDAGVSSASILTRDSAGWMRICSRSNSSPCGPATTTSPSTMHSGGKVPTSAGTSSGKYRFSGFLSRLWMYASPPETNTIARNPSHFGS